MNWNTGNRPGAADYDGDGFAALAISSTRVPSSGVGGTVTVIEGTSVGLVSTGSEIWDAKAILSLGK